MQLFFKNFDMLHDYLLAKNVELYLLDTCVVVYRECFHCYHRKKLQLNLTNLQHVSCIRISCREIWLFTFLQAPFCCIAAVRKFSVDVIPYLQAVVCACNSSNFTLIGCLGVCRKTVRLFNKLKQKTMKSSAIILHSTSGIFYFCRKWS